MVGWQGARQAAGEKLLQHPRPPPPCSEPTLQTSQQSREGPRQRGTSYLSPRWGTGLWIEPCSEAWGRQERARGGPSPGLVLSSRRTHQPTQNLKQRKRIHSGVAGTFQRRPTRGGLRPREAPGDRSHTLRGAGGTLSHSAWPSPRMTLDGDLTSLTLGQWDNKTRSPRLCL